MQLSVNGSTIAPPQAQPNHSGKATAQEEESGWFGDGIIVGRKHCCFVHHNTCTKCSKICSPATADVIQHGSIADDREVRRHHRLHRIITRLGKKDIKGSSEELAGWFITPQMSCKLG